MKAKIWAWMVASSPRRAGGNRLEGRTTAKAGYTEGQSAAHRFRCRQRLVNPPGRAFEVGVVGAEHNPGVFRSRGMESTEMMPAIERHEDPSKGDRILQHRCIGVPPVGLAVLEDGQDVMSQPAQLSRRREEDRSRPHTTKPRVMPLRSRRSADRSPPGEDRSRTRRCRGLPHAGKDMHAGGPTPLLPSPGRPYQHPHRNPRSHHTRLAPAHAGGALNPRGGMARQAYEPLQRLRPFTRRQLCNQLSHRIQSWHGNRPAVTKPRPNRG